MMILLSHALVSTRLDGRHGRDRRQTMEWLAEDGFFDEADMKLLDAAFTEGVEASSSGYPCHCPTCSSLIPAMREREHVRMAYAQRRRDELKSSGLSYEAITGKIDREIDAGAALQTVPTVVSKTRGSQP